MWRNIAAARFRDWTVLFYSHCNTTDCTEWKVLYEKASDVELTSELIDRCDCVENEIVECFDWHCDYFPWIACRKCMKVSWLFWMSPFDSWTETLDSKIDREWDWWRKLCNSLDLDVFHESLEEAIEDFSDSHKEEEHMSVYLKYLYHWFSKDIKVQKDVEWLLDDDSDE